MELSLQFSRIDFPTENPSKRGYGFPFAPSRSDCLKQCMALIKKGESVFIFPEGTRSKDGKLGPFEKGAFSIAAKTGVPIVPISLIGTGEIMPPGFEGRLNPGSMKIIVHQPIVGKNSDALCMQGS